MAEGSDADLGFGVVRTAIGAGLRTLFSDVLQEPVPERIAELLRQLDRATEGGRDIDNAAPR